MIIRRLSDLPREVVLDGSRLVEYMHPTGDPAPRQSGTAWLMLSSGEVKRPSPTG